MSADNHNFISQIQTAVKAKVAGGTLPEHLDPNSDEGQFMRLLEEMKSVRGIQVRGNMMKECCIAMGDCPQ